MLRIGLTGGIGCGKSTAVNAFSALGGAIVDADQISKDLVKAGSSTLLKIVKKFGNDVLLPNGELNRIKLKEIVFSSAYSLEALEAIMHPEIKTKINRQIAALSGSPYVIVDIPLLVEKNYTDMFDRIVVVDCLPKQQIARVTQRDELSEATIKSIMEKQASREVRLKAATDTLDNLGDIKELEKQVISLHKQFLRKISSKEKR